MGINPLHLYEMGSTSGLKYRWSKFVRKKPFPMSCTGIKQLKGNEGDLLGYQV